MYIIYFDKISNFEIVQTMNKLWFEKIKHKFDNARNRIILIK